MSPFTVTSGRESRLDGAPSLPIWGEDANEVDAMMARNPTMTRAEAQAEVRRVNDLDVASAMMAENPMMTQEEALAKARQFKAKRMAEEQKNRERLAARQTAWNERQAQREQARSGDTRPDAVLEDNLVYEQNLADTVIGGYRTQGVQLRPGTPAWDARDRLMASQGRNTRYGSSPDPANDRQTLEDEYVRRFGAPAQTDEDLDLARTLMIEDYQRGQSLDGTLATAPGTWGAQKPFESQYQADQYNTMRPGELSPLQRDMARADYGRQGMVMVYKNGVAGPAMRAPTPEGAAEPGFTNSQLGNQQIGDLVESGQVSPDLRRPDLESKSRRYAPRLMQGPSGPEWVYDLTDTARQDGIGQREKAIENRRRLEYMANAGLTMEEAEGMGTQELRERSTLARIQQQRAQKANARRLITEDAQLRSGRPGLQMAQMDPGFRQVAFLDAATGGRRGGATPNDIEKARNEQLTALGLATAQGRGFQQVTPLEQAQMEAAQRKGMPEITGQQDIAEGNYQTPEALAEFDAVALRHDTTRLGFSFDNERALADTLQKPPYNMPKPKAKAKAFELAEKRRYLSGGQPGGPPPGESGGFFDWSWLLGGGEEDTPQPDRPRAPAPPAGPQPRGAGGRVRSRNRPVPPPPDQPVGWR